MKIKITILFLLFALGANAQAWWFAVQQDVVLPISLWRLDETSGTNVADAIGGNDGTNNGATINQPSVSKAYSFDGTNDRIVVQDANQIDLSEISISAWIYADTYGTLVGSNRFGRIVRKGSNYDLMTVNSSTAGHFATILFSGSGNLYGTDNAISLNTWYHVIVTDDGVTAKLYIDGSLDNSGSSVIGSTNTDDLIIGNFEDGTAIPRFFDGILDQVAVFDEAVTTDDIAELYEDKAGLYYDNWTASLQAKAVTVWELDEISGTTVLDQVTEIDGINNGATINVAGIVSDLLKSYDFNGTSDNITIPDNAVFDTGGELSISLWCNFNDVRNTGRSLFLHDLSDYKYLIYKLSASNDVRFYVKTSSGTTFTTPDQTVGDDKWHHVVCVYDKNNASSQRLKMYVDGVLEASAAGYAEDILSGDEGITMGVVGAGYYEGFLDQVRFYDFAITSEDVTNLYKNGRGN